MSPVDAVSYAHWDSLENWGSVLVIAGVAVESVELIIEAIVFRREQFIREAALSRTTKRIMLWIKSAFFVVLVAGLAMESIGENRKSGLQFKENNEQTQRAADQETKAEKLESENSELKKTQEPRFEKFDVATFRIMASHPKSKVRVELLYQDGDMDSYELEEVMKTALVSDGWTTLGPRPIAEPDALLGSDKDAPMSIRAGVDPKNAVGHPVGSENFITFVVMKKTWSPLGTMPPPSEYPVDWLLGAFTASLGTNGAASYSRVSNSLMPDDLVRFIIGPKSRRW